MNVKRIARWKTPVVMLLGLGVILAYAIVVKREARTIALERVHSLARPIRDRGKWVPQDFFDTSDAIQACEAISLRQHDKLRQLVTSDLDINHSGRAGMTLLHWAFISDDLDAFKLLLESGADPDKRLQYTITLQNGRRMYYGDSVLFTSLRQAKWDFFFAAKEQTADINQLDASGDTLLIAALGEYGLGTTNQTLLKINKELLQRILDTGVNLDARGKFGRTAALQAIGSGRPSICLTILEAGADPEIPAYDGETIYGRLKDNIALYEQRSEADRLAEAERLKQWLDARLGNALEE